MPATRFPSRPRAAVCLLAASLAACASAPERRLTSQDVRSLPPALSETTVPLLGPAGALATARLGASGILRQRIQDSERPVLHVRLRIENPGARPLTIPLWLLRLEGIAVKDVVPVSIFAEPGAREERVEVAPGAEASVDVLFPLPDGVTADDVRDFRLAWGVDAVDVHVRKTTTFGPAKSPDGKRLARSYRPMTTF